jgi:hypothetical protein
MKPTTAAVTVMSCLGLLLLGALQHLLSRSDLYRESYTASVGGSFQGPRPGHVGKATSLAYWESGAGRGPGSVRIGPFPAPDRLAFALARENPADASEVYLELELLKLRLPLQIQPAPAGAWSTVSVTLPYGWRGRLITLNARSGGGADLRISQPLGRDSGDYRHYGLAVTVIAFLANALLYGLFFGAFATLLETRGRVPGHWVPLAALGGVAALGYLAFWAYFLSPAFGKAATGAFAASACLYGLAAGRSGRSRDAQWIPVGFLTVAVGALYLGVLYLFPSRLDIYDLAQNRFALGLPGDNRLPFDFAQQLYDGNRPKELGAGWLTSDRPPLEEGWQLLGWAATDLLGLPAQTASATASLLLQLTWVASLYGLLRTLGADPRRSRAVVAVATLNGFFLVHSLFTWPKLSAGAFVCGGFGLWALGARPSRAAERCGGAGFSALGLLSHGGAGFPLLAMGPWILRRLGREGLRRWVGPLALGLLLVVPWACYQRFYAPPGNRLLKWHLAGQAEIDGRSFLQTVVDSYRALTWRRFLEQRLSNLRILGQGHWAALAQGTSRAAAGRRADEYLHFFRALGWWHLSLLAAALGVGRAASARRRGPLRSLCGWALLTLLIWVGLQFTETSIHQGSFAPLIVLFAVYGALLSRSVLALGSVGLLQAYTFVTTWLPNPAAGSGGPGLAPLLLMAASLLMLAWVVGRRPAGGSGGALRSPLPAGAEPASPPGPGLAPRALVSQPRVLITAPGAWAELRPLGRRVEPVALDAVERRPPTLALEAQVVPAVVVEPEGQEDRPDGRAVGGGHGGELEHGGFGRMQRAEGELRRVPAAR